MEWIIVGILIAIGIYLSPIVIGIILIAIGIVGQAIVEIVNSFKGR